ncbi:hypothetical protein ACFSR6_03870 [Pedobacter vanadiisoli]|uniref:Uncharacterized protein n=1 Tax=Pedobacter vanadiisoli TaxID=1761975 RepID=A0ABW5MGN0_9SPHI
MKNTIKLTALVLFSISSLIVNAQTATRDNAGLQGDAGAVSGFFETVNPVNYPAGSNGWWHLLDVRHGNNNNNYAMQFAGSFFNQELYFRKTNNNAGQPWSKVLLETNGNVGIGTSSPSTRLEVMPPAINESSAGVFHLRGDQAWGNVLTLATDAANGNDDAKLLFSYRNKSKQWSIGGNNGTTSFGIWEDGGDGVYGSGFGNQRFIVAAGGNVGIGISTPQEKLSVNGNIRAREIKVEATNWPDYVFEEGYKVGTLQELESYIKANKHLPDMPAAKEVETNGIEVSEMLKLQQKKIEELTLYLIEKDKKIDALMKRVDVLESNIQKPTNKNHK